MKEIEITIEGTTYRVKVEKFEGTHASVVVDGKKYDVDVSGMDLRMPPPSFARTPYASRPGLKMPSVPRPEAAPAASVSPPSASPAAGGKGTITAPMPGMILDIMVKVGDRVEQGAMVAKIEAMKMENEIPATAGGTVKSIAVKKGDSVATGDVLLEIG